MITPLKVLLVDDDIDFGKVICMGLKALGHEIHYQTTLSGIEEVIEKFSPSIIVLDVEIGEENGIEKAREIIPLFPSIPVLFVSSHIDISYIAEGISVGGVNYLKKPFDIRELDVYMQRFSKKQSISDNKPIGKYLLHYDTNELWYDGALVKKLTPLEKNGLLLLMEHRNSPVTYDKIAKNLWGKSYIPDLEPSIHNLISKLRKIVNRDEQVMINTIKGVGYMLKD